MKPKMKAPIVVFVRRSAASRVEPEQVETEVKDDAENMHASPKPGDWNERLRGEVIGLFRSFGGIVNPTEPTANVGPQKRTATRACPVAVRRVGERRP